MSKKTYREELQEYWGKFSGTDNPLKPTHLVENERHQNDDTDYFVWMNFHNISCPICGRGVDWCMVNPENDLIICNHSAEISAKTMKIYDSLWVRKSDNSNTWFKKKGAKVDATYVPKQRKKNNNLKVADPFITDFLSRILLHSYGLSDYDKTNLFKRGLTQSDLDNMSPLRGFGSFTLGSKTVHDQEYDLKKEKNGKFVVTKSLWEDALQRNNLPKNAWKGMPGLYGETKKGKIPETPSLNLGEKIGILVPYYNPDGFITAFQYRNDYPLPKVRIKGNKSIRVLKPEFKSYFSYEEKAGYSMRVNIKNSNSYLVFDTYRFKQQISVIFYRNNTSEGKEFYFEKVNYIWKTLDLSQFGIDLRIQFKVQNGPKYKWLTSGGRKDGVSFTGNSPAEIAYRPSIARLEAGDKQLIAYKHEPKAVWITEGGLKAIVTSKLLPRFFTQKELDQLGHDVIGLPGVTMQNRLFPSKHSSEKSLLDILNVKSATVAFDMDMKTNKNVKLQTVKLINRLIKKGIKVRIALWSYKDGKGIDDILNNPNCHIIFKDINSNLINQLKKSKQVSK